MLMFLHRWAILKLRIEEDDPAPIIVLLHDDMVIVYWCTFLGDDLQSLLRWEWTLLNRVFFCYFKDCALSCTKLVILDPVRQIWLGYHRVGLVVVQRLEVYASDKMGCLLD